MATQGLQWRPFSLNYRKQLKPVKRELDNTQNSINNTLLYTKILKFEFLEFQQFPVPLCPGSARYSWFCSISQISNLSNATAHVTLLK